MAKDTELELAYRFCVEYTENHHEVFPVASKLLPKALRKPISVIYTFARQADDMADEGNLLEQERLEQLNTYSSALSEFPKNNPVFVVLNDVLNQYPSLPIQLFHDLLSAFKQDVIKNRYNSFSEILDYCTRSANPIGQMLLYLTHRATEQNKIYSDYICTALQLINFIKDLQSDLFTRDRCYFPLDQLHIRNISVDTLKHDPRNPKAIDLIQWQLYEATQLLNRGTPLVHNLNGLFRLEIALVIHSAHRMIDKLLRRSSIHTRPELSRWDWTKALFRALISPPERLIFSGTLYKHPFFKPTHE